MLTLGRVAAIPALIAGTPLQQMQRHVQLCCAVAGQSGVYAHVQQQAQHKAKHANILLSLLANFQLTARKPWSHHDCSCSAVWFWQDPAASTVVTALFVAAAITDWLDGYLARKMVGAGPAGQWYTLSLYKCW